MLGTVYLLEFLELVKTKELAELELRWRKQYKDCNYLDLIDKSN